MDFPVWALLTTGLVKTTLNETLSGTVPVGVKFLTPAGIFDTDREGADIAAAGMSRRNTAISKNLLCFSKMYTVLS